MGSIPKKQRDITFVHKLYIIFILHATDIQVVGGEQVTAVAVTGGTVAGSGVVHGGAVGQVIVTGSGVGQLLSESTELMI